MYTGPHVKYPLFFSHVNENLHFLDRVSKNIQIPNFMNIRSVGAELFHADGGTAMTKLVHVFFFRYFANAPKSVTTIYLSVLVL
jgi:hypothetical protein